MLNVANVPLHHHQNSTHQSSNLDVGGVDLHHHLHLNHNRNNKSSSSLSQKASYTTSASSSPLVLRVSKTAPNSKSSSSTSLASSSTNNTQQTQTPGTPSRIPVYSQNRNGSQQQQQGRSRLNSLSDTLKHYHQLHHQLLQQQHHLQHQQPLNQSTKHSLSAHQLSDLPEDVKLMHIVHCHCSHNLNSASMPRSKTHDFTANGLRKGANSSSVPSSSSTPGTSTPKGRKQSNASNAASRYEEYLPLCEMQKGLEKGEIVEGILRINPKNYNDAYISAPDGGLDIFIGGLYDRNRALNGDLVAVKLNDVDKWTLFPSSINAHWDEWKADFEKVLAKEEEEEGKAGGLQKDIILSQARLNQLLNSADLKKQGTHRRRSERTLAVEFPQVPLALYRLDLATLHRQLPAISGQFIQKSGKVVALSQANHSRVVGGTIALQQGNIQKAKLMSSDSRVPHVMLPYSSLPRDFVRSYAQLKENLFLVEITEWKESSLFPHGRILQTLGTVGDLESEMEVLLRSNDIDTADFAEEALAEYDLFSVDGWKIPEEELSYRRDFRQQCVFTIDPQSARDLDDAISLVKLSTGATEKESVYELGVHIADVSYFIRERTLLDGIAKERATSVYLPSRVIPMLPHLFCQQLCSLNPGEDKLTFSVVFKMTGDGQLLQGEEGRPWIGRTVINSCAKLSYEHAQAMIEVPAVEELISSPEKAEAFPAIHGHWPLTLLATQTGSLRLDKTRIGFLLDETTGLPVSFAKQELKDSNRLIEELMLAANRAVAERLHEVFARSGRAFLRGHPPPNANSMNQFAAFAASTGFAADFDTSSSGAIYRSLEKLQHTVSSSAGVDAATSTANFRLFSLHLIKSMKLAVYQTVGDGDKPASYHHYALNFPKYTHFTSPIRRYADVIVHRLLCEALGYDHSHCSSADATELRRIAANCNARKQAAFIVSEKANELYLKKYIASIESLTTPAVVCAVYDHSFDVLVLQFDIVVRVYLDRLPLERFELLKEDSGDARLLLQWSPKVAGEGQGVMGSSAQEEVLSLKQTIVSLQQLDVKISVDKKFMFHVLIAHPNGDFVSSDLVSSGAAPLSGSGKKKELAGNSKPRNSASESSTNGEVVAEVVAEIQ
ncbi:DIS3-like exonuclease 2 [Tyrophagus putrescentiae]|nr:DIS3-like exonuclease 2 [Tyrophagus putrescentiae]